MRVQLIRKLSYNSLPPYPHNLPYPHNIPTPVYDLTDLHYLSRFPQSDGLRERRKLGPNGLRFLIVRIRLEFVIRNVASTGFRACQGFGFDVYSECNRCRIIIRTLYITSTPASTLTLVSGNPYRVTLKRTMAPIGVGIIGLSADRSAWATIAHSSPLRSAPLNEKFKLVAVGTSSPETAKKAAEAHGIEADKAYSSPEAIANDKNVDLVVVSVKVCWFISYRVEGGEGEREIKEQSATGLSRVALAVSTYVQWLRQQGCEPTEWLALTLTEQVHQGNEYGRLTPNPQTPLHKQLALPALHAKKSVIVEWPLGNGLGEAEELAALAKKQGVKTAVVLQARLHPSVQKAKSIIDSGALGRIIGTTLVASGSMFVNPPAKHSYLNDPKNGANVVTIHTIHSLDPLCYLLGEFKSLNATTAATFPEIHFIQADGSKTEPVKRNVADFISIQGVLESGVTVSFVSSSTTEATPGHLEWIISGEKSSLKFEGPSQFIATAPHTLYQTVPSKQDGKETEKKGVYATKEGWSWEKVEVEKGTFGSIGEVYAAFAEGNKDLVDFDEAVKRHKLVEAIFRSAENGTRESC